MLWPSSMLCYWPADIILSDYYIIDSVSTQGETWIISDRTKVSSLAEGWQH